MDTPQGGSDPVESNPSSSPVFIVSNFWKELDLEKEKSLLDGQGLRIAENLENSQKNRRKLAESTRNFKKASAEEKLRLFNSLLKGYQEEIDNLTKRAKFEMERWEEKWQNERKVQKQRDQEGSPMV
ncbi:hypothetical protein ES288_D12G310000v1 [Gossypium darwinii]|uniref:Cux N-terminal domain-containing protein n=1 Tax=Gossypium darwinii TaxID=34276 RepID=A0A5D2AE37_GOSDA|nr:hypothetical protein ES288_D12G310000v1 [Gossypium darwinii]